MSTIASPSRRIQGLAYPAQSTGLGSVRTFTRATYFDPITTVFAWIACLAIDLYAMTVTRELSHWFIVPLTICGVVLAHDCVNWFRGKMNLLDPIGIIGFLGFHFFYLVNILQFGWNEWMVPPEIRPADIRPWIGWISIINLGCLLMYRYLRDPFAGTWNRSKSKVWAVDPMRFQIVIIIGFVVCCVLQVFVYASWGGVANYIQAIESRAQKQELDTGFISAISESAPILLLIGYVFMARRRRTLASWPMLIAFMVVYFVMVMLFGGLRGSRGNTVWAIFWAAGMIHFMVRPLNKKAIFLGLMVLTLFMYIYGFYKNAGLRGVQAVAGGADIESLEHKTGRSFHGLLIGDLARGEIHAFFLRQLFNRELDYDLALGRTYYATICRLIPSSIWPDRPVLKNLESTELQYGKGSYDELHRKSSWAHGLGAEAMMNFGVAGIPIAYLLWILLVARIRKWVLCWDSQDMRLFLAPILINLCFVALIGDSDNIFQFIFKNAALPFFVIWITSRGVRPAPLPPRTFFGPLDSRGHYAPTILRPAS
jgi:hypothetical protein